jgi:hypothetical protein
MFETTTHRSVQNAFDRAHETRGETLRQAFAWLFPSKTSR